jgi:uncharacterized protein (DUF362 family)
MREKNKMNRRQFIKSMTAGNMALLYGCSRDTMTLTEPDKPIIPPPPESETTKITLYKTQDRKEGVKKVLELLDFSPVENKSVIIKPNFNTSDPAPASTHNDTLSQIVVELRDRGASQITVAERSYQSFQSVIEDKEIISLANNYNFEIKNLEDSNKTHFKRSGLNWNNGFNVPDDILNAEYIVSTCCLKTHQYGGIFTMSLKLSVGILPFSHMNELHNSPRMRAMIAEINLAYKPELIVMDGIKAFIDGGPSVGTERDGNVMVAGTDRIAIDAVGVAILKNLGSSRVNGQIFKQDQIKRAVELDIGINNPDQIEFITPDEPSRKYADTLRSILANG